jgi:hypothetical protein
MRLNFYSNFVQLIYELNSSEVYMNRAQAVNEQIDSFTILFYYKSLRLVNLGRKCGETWYFIKRNNTYTFSTYFHTIKF